MIFYDAMGYDINLYLHKNQYNILHYKKNQLYPFVFADASQYTS